MSTVTTKTENSQLKNKQKDLREATASRNLDEVLEKVKVIDNGCTFTKCKNKTTLISIDCKFCKGRFCTTHGLPEIHGCGEAVRREEKREYKHPEPKLTRENHEKAQTKLTVKLKQMELQRKSKQGTKNKEKEKK